MTQKYLGYSIIGHRKRKSKMPYIVIILIVLIVAVVFYYLSTRSR